MIWPIGMIVVGLVLLAGGGEVLLRGAVDLAKRLRLSPAIIGLTVVAAGTSVPELAVSFLASLQGQADIAVSNVVGSNIFNASAILGVAALVSPLAVTGNIIKLEYPVMVLVTFLCVVAFDDGHVSRLDASLFVVTYVAFTTYMIGVVRGQMAKDEENQLQNEVAELSGAAHSDPSLMRSLMYVGGGVILLGIGAEVTVRGAVELGRLFGMSERVIGLTIVAFGTSLPEVVTSLIAGFRGRDDIAIGNVIGSNIFNILIILGVSALVTPLSVSAELRGNDSYYMLGGAVLLFPIMRSGMKISRIEGAALLGIYGTYLGIVLL